MHALRRVVAVLVFFVLAGAASAQQTGGTTWATNYLTVAAPGGTWSINADSTNSTNFTIEKVQYWDPKARNGAGDWVTITEGHSNVPALHQVSELGGNYAQGTVFRVLVSYQSSTVPQVKLSEP